MLDALWDLLYGLVGEAIIWIGFALVIACGVGFILFTLFGWKTEAHTSSELEERGRHFLIAGLLLLCFVLGGGIFSRTHRNR